MKWRVALAGGVCVISLARPSGALAADAASIYARSKSAVVTVKTDSSVGTGFAVLDGSLVITCYHVVKDSEYVTVSATGAARVDVVACDEGQDIAILRLPKRLNNHLAIRSQTPEPGTKIYAIGTPLGYLDRTISEGIVSGKRWTGDATYLQFTAPISEGSSGSPLLDSAGCVVGMVDFYLAHGQNLNFAVCGYNLERQLAAWRARETQVAKVIADSKNAAKHGKRLLGYLGQSRRESDILAAPDPDAELYYRVAPFEYVVVLPCKDPAWYKVLMQNGKFGYARILDVCKLPYQITAGGAPKANQVTAGDALGANIAKFAMSLDRVAYAEGGHDTTGGIGSGELVQIAYACWGYDLSPDPAEQVDHGVPITRLEDLKAGDRLYFWDEGKKGIGTAAIYVGKGCMVIADKVAGKVCTKYLGEKKLLDALVAARRGGPRSDRQPGQ